MESVDFMSGRPDDSLLLFDVLCYDYMGDEFLLDLRSYKSNPMDAYWINPQDGTDSFITTLQGVDKWLASPVSRKDKANDWVLVLKAAG